MRRGGWREKDTSDNNVTKPSARPINENYYPFSQNDTIRNPTTGDDTPPATRGVSRQILNTMRAFLRPGEKIELTIIRIQWLRVMFKRLWLVMIFTDFGTFFFLSSAFNSC